MSVIWTSRTRTRQPQGVVGVNPSKERWSFLWNATAPRTNLALGAGTPINSPTGAVPVAGVNGVLIDGLATTAQLEFAAPLPTTMYSFVLVVAPLRSNSGGVAIRTTEGDGFRVLATTTGGGFYVSIINSGVANGAGVVFATTEFDTRTYTVVGTYDGTTSTLWARAPSGEIKTSSVAAGIAPATGYVGIIEPPSLGVGLAAMSLAAISDARARELLSNPWQLFAPQPHPRFFSLPSPTLFSKVDETSANDADYITAATAGSMAELQLGSVTDPGVDTLISMKLRASGSGSLKVDLVQGSGALLTIWTSKTRTAQPPVLTAVNWADSLTRGLRILDHGQLSGRRADPKLQDVVSDSAVSADTVGGVARRGTLGKLHTPFDLSVTEAATFFAVGRFAAPEQNDCRLVVKAGGSSGMTGVAVHGGSQKLRKFSVAGNTTSWELSLDVPAASIYSYASQILTIDAAGNCVAYLDGVVVGTGSITGGMVTRTDQKFTTIGGGYADNTTNAAAVDLLIGGVFDRALSGVEAWLLSRRYWRLIAPENRPRHIPATKPIATRTIPLVSTPTDYRRELLPAEAALITDYADLRVRFTGV